MQREKRVQPAGDDWRQDQGTEERARNERAFRVIAEVASRMSPDSTTADADELFGMLNDSGLGPEDHLRITCLFLGYTGQFLRDPEFWLDWHLNKPVQVYAQLKREGRKPW